MLHFIVDAGLGYHFVSLYCVDSGSNATLQILMKHFSRVNQASVMYKCFPVAVILMQGSYGPDITSHRYDGSHASLARIRPPFTRVVVDRLRDPVEEEPGADAAGK